MRVPESGLRPFLTAHALSYDSKQWNFIISKVQLQTITSFVLQFKMAFCSLVLPSIFFVLVAVSSYVIAITFTPLTSAYGSPICVTENPTVVILSSTAQPGIPDGVPLTVRCGFSCSQFSGCVGYNYRHLPRVLPGDALCELFTSRPNDCTTIGDSCQYFEVDV